MHGSLSALESRKHVSLCGVNIAESGQVLTHKIVSQFFKLTLYVLLTPP